MFDRIQDGVYFRSGQRPPPCYRLVLLNANEHATGGAVRSGLGRVFEMLERLKSGELRELVGAGDDAARSTAESFRGLDVLLGFGRRLFDDKYHEPSLTPERRPDFLAYLPRRGDPFPALPWGIADETDNRGEADLALQLTGPSEAAVNRAVVEIWKLLVDDAVPLKPSASFSGFQRGDGRGWLEFLDGVSNIEAGHRLHSLAAPPDPEWMEGGTYMAYLRFAIDLRVWRELSRSQQELLVGRDKLSGAPLVAVKREVDSDATPVPAERLGEGSSPQTRAEYADPPQTTDALLEGSHIHRANQNRASPFAPGGLRIFRQGYDFLDSVGPEGPILGLNFVSFQSDLATVQHILRLPGWLGDVNFGGSVDPKPGEPPSPRLITLLAGGLYAVPRRGDMFAEIDIFPMD